MFFKNTGMFYIPALCLLALYACWGDADLSQDKFVPFEGESLYSSPQLAEDVGIKVTASVYPSEIYYGDMAYKGIYSGLFPENLEFEDFELRLIQSKSKPV